LADHLCPTISSVICYYESTTFKETNGAQVVHPDGQCYVLHTCCRSPVKRLPDESPAQALIAVFWQQPDTQFGFAHVSIASGQAKEPTPSYDLVLILGDQQQVAWAGRRFQRVGPGRRRVEPQRAHPAAFGADSIDSFL
jgi:hypothetical protein